VRWVTKPALLSGYPRQLAAVGRADAWVTDTRDGFWEAGAALPGWSGCTRHYDSERAAKRAAIGMARRLAAPGARA
jgi:hypothetical protein